jgi:hypothetical protein
MGEATFGLNNIRSPQKETCNYLLHPICKTTNTGQVYCAIYTITYANSVSKK